MINELPMFASQRDILSVFDRIVNCGGCTQATKLVRYSHIKAYLRQHRPEWMRFVRPPAALVDEVKMERLERRSEMDTIFISRSIVDTIFSWKNSDNYLRSIAWLQLASGRRISEIIECSFYEDIRHCSRITSQNLKKKRQKVLDVDVFPIHCSSSAAEWMDILRRARKKLKGKMVNNITRIHNENLRKEFPYDRITSHKLRGIYANVMWHESGQIQNQTGFIQDVLCLQSQDVAIHYANYILE
jgi:hypothetical protein